MVRPFGALIERKVGEIDRRYAAFLANGYPVELEGNAETLQLIEDRDRTNWLIVQGICNEALAAEMGDVNMPSPIICTSGNEYVLTFAACGWMIREMRQWGIDADANWRAMVKAARSVQRWQDLDLIDLEAGWP